MVCAEYGAEYGAPNHPQEVSRKYWSRAQACRAILAVTNTLRSVSVTWMILSWIWPERLRDLEAVFI